MTEEECAKAYAQVMALPKAKRELLSSSAVKYVVMQTYPYHHFMRDSDGYDIFSTFDKKEATEYCEQLTQQTNNCDYSVFKLEVA